MRKLGHIQRLPELNEGNRNQQWKPPNTKSDIWHTGRPKRTEKQMMLCKVPAHKGIKGNKTAKEATNMPGLITRLDNYEESKELRMAEGMRK